MARYNRNSLIAHMAGFYDCVEIKGSKSFGGFIVSIEKGLRFDVSWNNDTDLYTIIEPDGSTHLINCFELFGVLQSIKVKHAG